MQDVRADWPPDVSGSVSVDLSFKVQAFICILILVRVPASL